MPIHHHAHALGQLGIVEVLARAETTTGPRDNQASHLAVSHRGFELGPQLQLHGAGEAVRAPPAG